VTRLRAGRPGLDSRKGQGFILLTTAFRLALGPSQPHNQLALGSVSLGVKWSVRKTNNSPQSSAEVKNEWSYISTPQYTFISWYLVKHKDKFTFHHPNLYSHLRLGLASCLIL
jgi:hypothetical protein